MAWGKERKEKNASLLIGEHNSTLQDYWENSAKHAVFTRQASH
jgi:hypothetical protein